MLDKNGVLSDLLRALRQLAQGILKPGEVYHAINATYIGE